MRVLLDTHTFIWYTGDGSNLSQRAKDLIVAETTDVAVSIVSLWEISIKIALGRLELDRNFEHLPDVLAEYAIDILHLDFGHALKQSSLPFHHKDPFDRIIAAQALVEEIDLVSIDSIFDVYFAGSDVKRRW